MLKIEATPVARTKSVRPAVINAKTIGIGGGLLAAVVAICFTVANVTAKKADGAAATAAKAAVVTVTTAPAQWQTVEDTVAVTGSISAKDPLSIGSEISGLQIKSVNVEEGDYVHKGQTLATLNSALLQAQLNEAKARLLSSEATLRKSIQPNRPEEISSLRAALAEAQANTQQEEAHRKEAKVNYLNAVTNAKRYNKLAQIGAVSFEDAENKQLAADTAQDELAGHEAKVSALRSVEEKANQSLVKAERGGRSEDIEISKATIEQTRAQIQQLEEQIRETIITAPADGLIAKRDAHIGDIATAGKTLFSIIRMNQLELRAQANDLDLPKFHVGQSVRISTTEDQDGDVIGKIWLVSPQVDNATRLGVVRIDVPEKAGLKSGMFVRGEVQLGSRKALTVPMDSLVTRNGESFVFTLDGDHAVSTPVKLGYQAENFVEINSGLQPGEKVIVKGARFLSDRDVVRISG